MYKIIIHKKAVKKYNTLPPSEKKRIDKAIDKLKTNPFYGQDIKKLVGELDGNYRLRVGDFRIIFEIDKSKKLVIIKATDVRGDVYKK
jgi:mRNA interferase RelE/StbE